MPAGCQGTDPTSKGDYKDRSSGVGTPQNYPPYFAPGDPPYSPHIYLGPLEVSNFRETPVC